MVDESNDQVKEDLQEQEKPAEELIEESGSQKTQEQEEIAALQNELESLRLQSQEYLNGWQRERAEFTNFKKRMDREREIAYQNAAGSIIRRYLDVLDDFERALKNRPEQGEGSSWADGIELIYRKLLATLEAEGVQPMNTVGQPFDPNLHEAISQEHSPEHESGHIIDVVKNGYLLGDRVLRPALVRVAQ